MIIACVPALNEERSVGAVVRKLREAGFARIVVFDNASSDATGCEARKAGAEVIRVARRGKGCALQAIFRHCARQHAHAFVVDADDTYDLSTLAQNRDRFLAAPHRMLVGDRDRGSMQLSHRIGNRLINLLLCLRCQASLRDILSGYRFIPLALMRNARLRLPDFRTETELTLRCLQQGMPIEESPVGYTHRRWGASKLHAFRDGMRIMLLILTGIR